MTIYRPKSELEICAAFFATAAHEAVGQVRKYSGVPYITHPAAVRDILVQNVPSATDEMLAAAWLHDTVEDTKVEFDTVRRLFGREVYELVYWLTKASMHSTENRAARKEMDRKKLESAPADAQTIKYADLIHNTADIAQNDPKFWEVYREEKVALLKCMNKGNLTLHAKAWEQVKK